MAVNPAAAADAAAMLAARTRVATLCDTLTTRPTSISIFDESKGAAAYEQWRTSLVDHIRPAGKDFVGALLYDAVIPHAPEYNDATVLDDTPAGVPDLTMPQMRQAALLAVIRASLAPAGESIRLIQGCVHAGGIVQGQHGPLPQAMILLDQRWRGMVVTESAGDKARALHSATWPSEFSVDAYTNHFNVAVTRATAIGANPPGNTPPEAVMRSSWWPVIAEPPMSSPHYFAAAQEARITTGGACATVADRDEWLRAMVRTIGTLVRAGVDSASSGGRVAGAHLGAAVLMGAGPQVGAMAASARPGVQDATGTPFGGSATRPPPKGCAKCPLAPDGSKVVHPRGVKCDAVTSCEAWPRAPAMRSHRAARCVSPNSGEMAGGGFDHPTGSVHTAQRAARTRAIAS